MTQNSILPDPPVALAPLAGISDLPFRDIALKFGAGLVVSEMVASQEMVQAKHSTRAKAELGLDRSKTAVQIAGRETHWMAEAARVIQDQGAERIDINMGCPAKKVTSGLSGAALMRNEDHAISLVEAVVGATDLPVTLKMRLGWDDSNHNAPSLAAKAANAGVQMITVHGRTRCQFYKGTADWRAVRHVVDAVDVPVLVNGDIIDVATAQAALTQSQAAGVMIGRGSMGSPWVIREIAAALTNAPPPNRPSKHQIIDLICEHHASLVAFYGATLGVRNARKHLSAYLENFDVSKDFRHSIVTENNPDAVQLKLQGLWDFELRWPSHD